MVGGADIYDSQHAFEFRSINLGCSGNEGANFSYLLRYNYTNNAVEFVTKGSAGSYTRSLIPNPYLQRWYHVAVTHSGGAGFFFYVDGHTLSQLQADYSTAVGSTVGSGLSIGGIGGSSKQFSGDIVELAFYSQALPQSFIQSRMFQDQRTFSNLKAYYKLGYSANTNDFYHNFVTNPPAGTDPATAAGSGNIAFNHPSSFSFTVPSAAIIGNSSRKNINSTLSCCLGTRFLMLSGFSGLFENAFHNLIGSSTPDIAQILEQNRWSACNSFSVIGPSHRAALTLKRTQNPGQSCLNLK